MPVGPVTPQPTEHAPHEGMPFNAPSHNDSNHLDVKTRHSSHGNRFLREHESRPSRSGGDYNQSHHSRGMFERDREERRDNRHSSSRSHQLPIQVERSNSSPSSNYANIAPLIKREREYHDSDRKPHQSSHSERRQRGYSAKRRERDYTVHSERDYTVENKRDYTVHSEGDYAVRSEREDHGRLEHMEHRASSPRHNDQSLRSFRSGQREERYEHHVEPHFIPRPPQPPRHHLQDEQHYRHSDDYLHPYNTSDRLRAPPYAPPTTHDPFERIPPLMDRLGGSPNPRAQSIQARLGPPRITEPLDNNRGLVPFNADVSFPRHPPARMTSHHQPLPDLRQELGGHCAKPPPLMQDMSYPHPLSPRQSHPIAGASSVYRSSSPIRRPHSPPRGVASPMKSAPFPSRQTPPLPDHPPPPLLSPPRRPPSPTTRPPSLSPSVLPRQRGSHHGVTRGHHSPSTKRTESPSHHSSPSRHPRHSTGLKSPSSDTGMCVV